MAAAVSILGVIAGSCRATMPELMQVNQIVSKRMDVHAVAVPQVVATIRHVARLAKLADRWTDHTFELQRYGAAGPIDLLLLFLAGEQEAIRD